MSKSNLVLTMLIMQSFIVSGQDQQKEDAIKLVNRFATLVNSHDFTRIGEVISEDYQQHNPRVEQGLSGLKNGFSWFLTIFPDMKCRVEHIVVDGDMVAVRFEWSGTQTSEFMNIPPSDEKKSWKSADWWRIESGKLAEHWDVVDWTALRGQ